MNLENLDLDRVSAQAVADVLTGSGTPLQIALVITAVLLLVLCVFAAIASLYLSVRYVKYNRRQNSAGLTGEQAARRVLDSAGLQKIKVKTSGSLLFGNSYSHYFKKVRLRRRTVNKDSIASLAMGTQKAALAVLDAEGDPDMRTRTRLVPIIAFGPFAFIPLVIVGVVIDYVAFQSRGYVTLACLGLGLLFYIFSLVLSIKQLKTEKKAQQRSYALMRENGMATEDEIADIAKLFKLYNLQYVVDIVMSALEIIYYILQIALAVTSNGDSSSN